jgi:hypothetical protein
MGSPTPADFDDELSFNELTFGDDSDPEQSSPRPSKSPAEGGDADHDDGGYDSLPHVQTVTTMSPLGLRALPVTPPSLPLYSAVLEHVLASF